MIKSLNISLTYMCSANCIFCPNDRGECDTSTTGVMTDHCFNTLIEQAREIPELEQVTIGENGDCFLCLDVVKKLRYIRNSLPDVKIVMYTNFISSVAQQWRYIINEGLVNKVVCNIDSINPVQYATAKNADFYKMWENFTGFILMRSAMHKFNDIALEVNVLDPMVYFKTFEKSFDKYSCNFHEYPARDKTQQTIDTIKYLLCDKDVVQGILPCFWAERDKIGGHLENNFCPRIGRLETEVFIGPDGTWYACCLDSKNELKLGNILTQHLNYIAKGDKRKKLLTQLREGKFEEIGGPCKTVVACHSYKIGGEKDE